MIVRNIKNKGKPSYGRDMDVYGIYWNDGVRMYLVIPYPDYEGFLAFNENDVQMIDPVIRDCFVLRKSDRGDDIFLHWAADKDDLIYELMEHNPDAMKEFLRRVNSSNGFSDMNNL